MSSYISVIVEVWFIGGVPSDATVIINLAEITLYQEEHQSGTIRERVVISLLDRCKVGKVRYHRSYYHHH